MARLTRSQLLYDGCYAHVISRSIGKNEIFKDMQDFEAFCELLLKIKKESEFQVFHYCFMHTHFHLAVKAPEVSRFSKGLQKLKSQYTYHYHTKYKVSGPIWRGRFRSLIIENEAYLYACGQYIENNPVRAGMVQKNAEWEYSSARYYSEGKEDQVVDGYETANLPDLPKDIDIFDERIFENGLAIGSGFFKFQSGELVKQGRKGI